MGSESQGGMVLIPNRKGGDVNPLTPWKVQYAVARQEQPKQQRACPKLSLSLSRSQSGNQDFSCARDLNSYKYHSLIQLFCTTQLALPFLFFPLQLPTSLNIKHNTECFIFPAHHAYDTSSPPSSSSRRFLSDSPRCRLVRPWTPT